MLCYIIYMYHKVHYIHKQPPIGVLIKGALKICSKFIGEYSCQSATLIKL